MMKYLFSILCFFLLCSQGWAACGWDGNTGTAASAGTVDLNACFSDAAGKTGVVVIIAPAGTVSWDSNIDYSLAGLTNVTELTIQGNGIDSTIINGLGRIAITMSGTKKFTIKGFTFNQLTNMDYNVTPIEIYGTTTGATWRVTANKMNGPQGAAVRVNGRAYGVIDSNILYSDQAHYDSAMNAVLDGSTGGNYGNGGSDSFLAATDLGGATAVYFEGNTISYADGGVSISVVDGRSGMRVVYRHNTCTNCAITWHEGEIDLERGTRKWEFYNNTFIWDRSGVTKNLYCGAYLRGGTGVMFNNDWKVLHCNLGATCFTNSTPIILTQQRSTTACSPYNLGCNGTNGVWHTYCDPGLSWKMCVGNVPKLCTADGDCIGAYSGKCVNQDGYGLTPFWCRDQLGTGQEAVNTGVQAIEPAYFWNNNWCASSGTDCTPSTAAVTTGTETILKGTHFHEDSVSGTYPGAFTHAGGLNYTAYTCPHPLAGAGSCTGVGASGYAITGGADTTAPTVSSITIGTNGTSWTVAYSESVTCASTANCCDDFTAAMTTAGAITLSYASGSGSSSVVCTGSATVNSGDTVANGGVDYTTVAGGIADAATNDLASFTNKGVTNNSTQGGASPASITLTGSGAITLGGSATITLQ